MSKTVPISEFTCLKHNVKGCPICFSQEPTPELDSFEASVRKLIRVKQTPPGAISTRDLTVEAMSSTELGLKVKLITQAHQVALKALAQDLKAAVPKKNKYATGGHPLEHWNKAIDTTTAAQAAILEKWGLK